MKILYGAAPENYKVVWGQTTAQSVDELPKEIKLVAGKNDTAAFNAVITADERFALNVTSQPWFSQQAKRRNIRLETDFPFEATLSHVGTVLCDDAYRRSDVLLHDSVVEADDDSVLSVYCEIKVPASASKGSYNGKIKIYESYGFDKEEFVGEINVDLTV